MLLVTAVLLVLASIVALGLVMTGPVVTAVGDALGLGSIALTVWNVAKWPFILFAVMLIVALLYWATPNIRPPKFRWLSVGAAVAIVVWVVASLAFGLYVANFSSYNKTYGALAGVIVFLLWLWITNLALLFGAELDSELERGAPAAGGHPCGGRDPAGAEGHRQDRQGRAQARRGCRARARDPRGQCVRGAELTCVTGSCSRARVRVRRAGSR